MLQIVLMGAWPEHRAAPHCSQLEEHHWKQKEPWLPAQHPILGAGTRVSWPPSKTLSPGLASRCQHISPQSYSLAAPLRVIPALSQQDLTLRGARIRPLGQGPSCGTSPGWRGAMSGASSGCKSPPSAVAGPGWSPVQCWGHTEEQHTPSPCSHPSASVAMHWLWQGQQVQP